METGHRQYFIWPFGPVVDKYHIYLDKEVDEEKMSDYMSYGPTADDMEILKRCGLREAEIG